MRNVLSSRVLPLAWIALLGAGFAHAWRYETAPGVAAPAAAPAETGLVHLDPTRPTVVMFAHPDCPCTRASLDGLARLAERAGGRARIVVAIVGRGGSANADAARRIVGASVVEDPQGAEARRFGAVTSGQAFALAPGGAELFRGGLTSARGHYGPSDGLDAVASVLAGRKPSVGSAPVYGCPLGDGEAGR